MIEDRNYFQKELFDREASDLLTEGIFTLGPEGEILYLNHPAARLFGCDPKHVFKSPFFEFVTEAHRDTIRKRFEALENHSHDGGEWVLQTAKGEGARRIRVRVKPVYDDEGRILRVHGAVTGILSDHGSNDSYGSNREAMGRTEYVWKRIIDTIRNPLIILGSDLAVLQANEAALTRLKLSLSAVLGKPLYKVLHGLNQLLPHYEKLLTDARSGPVSVEVIESRLGGVFILNAASIRDEAGNSIGTALAFEDITKQKRIEDELRQKQEQVENILDGCPVAIFMIDRESKIMFWNRAGEILTNISRKECLNRALDLSSLYEGEHPPILAELLLEYSDSEILNIYGPRGIRRDDMFPERFVCRGRIWVKTEARDLEYVATRLTDSKGRVVGVIQCAQDVTEREQMQRRLQHAQKMEAVGTLAGGVSHEFNNILAAIQGYAQLIALEIDEDRPEAQHVKHIIGSCERAAGLTKKLLTFSRLEPGEKGPVKVNGVIEGVMQILRQTLAPQFELMSNLQSGLPFIMADPSQIEQVMLNLGVNARDAMPDGGYIKFESRLIELDSLFCRKHPWAKPGRYVEMIVEDNGSGMPPEIVERVFDPFFTTKEAGKGTGLGLSVAFSIVKNHGGHILAESPLDKRTGRGSRFKVHLPVPDEKQAKSSQPADDQIYQGRGEHVLVVDDEPRLLQIAREMLEVSGYRVDVANNGKEALNLYRNALAAEDGFQLVVMDLAMPEMDGGTCLRGILDVDPGAKILITTGYGEDDLPEGLPKEAIQGMLTKPFDFRTLLKKVGESLTN